MKTYEITYTDFAADKTQYPHGKRVVAGRIAAKNGIAAIQTLLRAKLANMEDLDIEAELDNAYRGGSIKRLHLCGITFEANIVRDAA